MKKSPSWIHSRSLFFCLSGTQTSIVSLKEMERDREATTVTFCPAVVQRHLSPPHVTQGWSTIKHYICFVVIIIVSLFSLFTNPILHPHTHRPMQAHTHAHTHTYKLNSSAQCLSAPTIISANDEKTKQMSPFAFNSPVRQLSLWTRHAHSKVNINQEYQLMSQKFKQTKQNNQ